jgi:hypothetical protein
MRQPSLATESKVVIARDSEREGGREGGRGGERTRLTAVSPPRRPAQARRCHPRHTTLLELKGAILDLVVVGHHGRSEVVETVV